MQIGLAALMAGLFFMEIMATQAMLERLNNVEAESDFWKRVLSPLTTALSLLDKGQRYVWKELLSIVSRFAGASLHALAHWFWSLEHLVTDTAHGIASLAETVADAFEHALGVTVPHAIRVAVQHEGRLRHIADEQLRRYARGIDRLLHDHVLPRLRAAERAVTVTIPREFQRAWARDRAIAGRIPRALRHRLTRVEKLTAVGAIAAVAIRTIARRFPWLFCRKTNMIGKRLCGLDADLLESLLADTLLIAGVVSIVEFAHALQAVTDTTAEAIHGFIRED